MPQTPARASAASERGRIILISLALVAITFAVFGQTLSHPFVEFDDGEYITANPTVRRGLTLRSIAWAFSFHESNWHPLTWLSHMLDCQLYGINPMGHHLTSVLIHTTTVVALFLLLRGLTGATWRSAFVAAVFAIHPLRVESAAWVAERKDLLCGLFFVLTIAAYVRYARRRSIGRYGLVAFLYALGLMCKPMLVTLPLVLLLLDWWPLRRSAPPGKLLLEKLPLLALSAGACALTLLAQRSGIQTTGTFVFPMRLANALVSYMIYLYQLVNPSGLAIFYPFPPHGTPAWQVALAVTLLAAFSLAAFLQRRKQPWLAVGWLWYLVMLVPVAGFVQVGDQAHADRYSYLPLIGICIALTWAVAEWVAKHNISQVACIAAASGVIGLFMAAAWVQAGFWSDDESLWREALACTDRNEVALFSLGNALRKEGKVDDAIAQYEEALKLRPDFTKAHINLGSALVSEGKFDDAILQFTEALKIDPSRENAENNLGYALMRQGKLTEAIPHLQRALQLNPDDATARYNLDQVLQKQSQAK